MQEGKKVKKGQVVGRVEDGKLGANMHASIDGKVRAVTAGIRRDRGIRRWQRIQSD